VTPVCQAKIGNNIRIDIAIHKKIVKQFKAKSIESTSQCAGFARGRYCGAYVTVRRIR